MTGLNGRPTAAELVAAVAEFLEGDVRANTTGSVNFHALVAANVLRTVERELLDETSAEPLAALEQLGYPDEDALAAAIRAGDLDDRGRRHHGQPAGPGPPPAGHRPPRIRPTRRRNALMPTHDQIIEAADRLFAAIVGGRRRGGDGAVVRRRHRLAPGRQPRQRQGARAEGDRVVRRRHHAAALRSARPAGVRRRLRAAAHPALHAPAAAKR